MARKTVVTKNEVHIALAGKSAAGKSTVAKNIFGMKTEITLSPNPITAVCTTKTVEKNGIRIHLTDTVGLQQSGKKTELRKLYQHTKMAKVDLLIYCMSVDPSSTFADGNPAIMRSLQDAYGKDIWKHCILIFTFSNHAWKWCKKNVKEHETTTEYEKFIKLYADKFKSELQNLGVKNINVEAVFNLDMATTPNDQQITIPAIPAGDEPEDSVLPRFKPNTIYFQDRDNAEIKKAMKIEDWRDVIFIEIAKKCNSDLQKSLLRYRYIGDRIEVLEGISGGIPLGAAIGAAIGGIVGLGAGPASPVASPILSAIGAAVGAIVIGIVGGVTGGGVKAKALKKD